MVEKIVLSINFIKGFGFGGSKYIVKFQNDLLETLRFIFVLKNGFFCEVQKC